MTGHDVQRRALLHALADPEDIQWIAQLQGGRLPDGQYVPPAIIDAGVVARFAQVDPELPAIIEELGLRIIPPWRPEPLPRFQNRDRWRSVLQQALEYSDRWGDESVAIGVLMRSLKANGWELDFPRARWLIRERRGLPNHVPAPAGVAAA